MFRSVLSESLLGSFVVAILVAIGAAFAQEPGAFRREPIVAAAAAREAQRTLTLLAVVEAVPDRTVLVLPPVAGRVVDLKIQRGDRVAQPVASKP